MNTFPTDQLAGLSINPRMSQRSRTEAQRARRIREREERTSLASLRSRVNTVSPGPDEQGTIHGSTRLRYQVGALAPAAQVTAIQGLTAGNLSAEAAKAHVLDGHGSYVAIQVVERLRLCIYATPRDGRIVDCSCPEMRNRTRTSVCAHIYWLYDRMVSSQYPSAATSVWPVALSDIEKVLWQITRRSNGEIDGLAEEISPSWTEPDEEIDHEVEDMLSLLDSDREKLSGDYSEEFYSDLPVSTNHRYQDLLVPSNLFNTIFALARHDSVLRDRLSNVITRERLDKDFLRKIRRRQVSAFFQLDKYVSEGTRLNPGTIGQCSLKLRDIISKVSEYRERVYEPSNPAFDRICARLAVRMFREICRRNKDIYADTIWLQQSSPSSPQDRNLYIRITSGWNQSPTNNNQFILDFLMDELPSQASLSSSRELGELSAKLTEFNAPGPVVERLNRFIREIRAEPQQPLSQLENYQSLTPSSTRSSRTNSGSSNGASCASNNSNPRGSRGVVRRPSSLEIPEPQRRRLQ